jgi:predicted PurR-regulated permease PerM
MCVAVTNDRSAWLPPRWVLAALLLVGLGALLHALRGVLTPVFAAFLIAYLLSPFVDRLEARRIPRALAILLLLGMLLGVIGLVLVLVLPGVLRDLAGFVRDLPRYTAEGLARAEPWLARYGVRIPHSFNEALTQYQLDTQELARRAVAPAGAVMRFIVGGTSSVFGALGTLFVVPVVAFYLLFDFHRITAGAASLVPKRWRDTAVAIAREIDETLAHFVRGQLIVMAVLGGLYAAAFSALGVRLAVPIGFVAGALAFIPYVGSATALVSALVLTFVDFDGWERVIGVLAAYVVIQMLEGLVITPRVIGDKVGLSPLWVLLALLAGAELFGFLGVLLALPTAAVLKIFVVRALRAYRASRLYGDDGTPTAEAPAVPPPAVPPPAVPPPVVPQPDAAQAAEPSQVVAQAAEPPPVLAQAAPSPGVAPVVPPPSASPPAASPESAPPSDLPPPASDGG